MKGIAACSLRWTRYDRRVNQGVTRRLVWLSFLFFITYTSIGLAEPKFIHLRNAEIALSRHQPHKTNERASGLFLIQLNGAPSSEMRAELEALRIKLLRYVSADAYVARFSAVELDKVEALPFVRGTTPYLDEYKVHSSLRNRGQANKPATVRVKMLLASDVTPQEAAQVHRTLQKMEHESNLRFGKIIEGTVTDVQLNALARSPSVLWIEPGPNIKLYDEIAAKIVGGDDGATGTPTISQQLGYDGSGVTVAVADSGLQEGDAETMHPDLAGRVDAFFAYGDLEDAADEHSHGTHVTGIIAGDAATGETDDYGYRYGLGVAPGAHIVAQRIFDGVGNYEAPPSFEALTHDAVRAGAKIGSNSWGDDTQGRYDLSAAEFDGLVRDADTGTAGDQPYILEFSAGNAGPGIQTIGSPAVAKNVIATGAVENDRFDLYIYDTGRDMMADFSSRGPTEDGRIKPDVVAPGTWIASLRSSLADDENAWAPISNNYLYQGGTSQAGPHVSGAAAVFVQYYRQTVTNTTPSPALVKAALINSCIDIEDGTGEAIAPNNNEGWGRVDLTEIVDSDRRFRFVDQTTSLTNGQTFETRLIVASSGEPLKITLAYSDVPAFPGTIPALVNDLDLEVIAPNGDTFTGNQLVYGESVPNATGYDSINNVEAVHIAVPIAGEYIVRVHGRNVVEDARPDTATIDQDFALVSSGDIPLPGAGVVFLDRRAYRAPDKIALTIIDPDLAAQPSVNVTVVSSTEPNGETVTLHPMRPGGVFTGSVVTATGIATIDGRLQLAHGDIIEARYTDASPAGPRIGTAHADFIPPIISNVFATNRFGRTVISWQTDEPANSVVYYGTNSILSASATNRTLATEHEVIIDGFIPGKTYQFKVASTDEAGNSATNNNNGNLYSIVAQAAATVLLVDAYTPVDPEGGATIPVTAYTDALAQTGVSYEVWNTSQFGSPGTNDLRLYPVVIWRINDNVFSDNTLTTVQQNTLKTYVTSGGGLLLTSMELLSRIGTSATALSFRTDVLHVASFAEDATVPAIEGIDNDPTTSGVDVDLDYSQYGSDLHELFGIPFDVADTITPTAVAAPILFETTSGRVAGVKYPRIGQDSNGRVVFLPFPIDTIPMSGPDPNNRANVLRNLLSFLIPGVNGLATITLDSDSYTVPSRVVVEIRDTDLAGLGEATVNFLSDTAPASQAVTLTETPLRGLFRGSIALVAATNSFQPGELRVHDGDTIAAEYFDASGNGVIRMTAIIDTVPPTITNVVCAPEYEEAIVTWQTSKPTDALVQFGESPLLNRTGYAFESEEDHSVTISGLQPDHSYYYRVVSRDTAGNTTIDDNNGALYTFRTFKPMSPPWLDTLENGTTNWVVLNGEAGTTTWELGTPNNGMESSAYSPTNAWGSNLKGNIIDLGDTTLASPAIDLTSGNRATLRFWHSYDFSMQSDSDIYELGQVYVSINNGNAWTQVAEFADSSFGWQQAEIDLTPYVGHVVRIGFYYGFFSLQSANHPGWLIDDISVSVTNAITDFRFKTIALTNNQTQLTFTAPAMNYVLESSTNLLNWIPIHTNVGTGGNIIFTDSQPPTATRFYRLRR